ncbi:hypothetical protein AGMMS49944_31500 [Spirochaetia bacterium]|nr:hypothetical protein AGMMS49944_31500 [Spirochaetia bacterium]
MGGTVSAMKKATAKGIADELFTESKNNYEAIQFLESLENPTMIKDRKTAIWACKIIKLTLRRCLGVKEGCVLDLLLLRVLDYIESGEAR